MIFVLDDDLDRVQWFRQAFGSGNVVHSMTVADALEKLAGQEFERVYLDYNISHPRQNGGDVAWAMYEGRMCQGTPVTIHSDDHFGQRTMKRILSKYHPDVTVMEFKQLKRKTP